MSVLTKLTEGIVDRNLEKEGAALRAKWEQTGLLEGIGDDRFKDNMACLLENQAKELLREASTMAQGDVEGFAAVAFPIVRRVFGGLIANDLVSVQPMSLPSGLIFFLDFQHTHAKLGTEAADSLFGGGRVGFQITGGVDLTGGNAEEGFYNLNNGYSSPTASVTLTKAATAIVVSEKAGHANISKLLRFDPDIASGSVCAVLKVPTATLTGSGGSKLNYDNLAAIQMNDPSHPDDAVNLGSHVRRLTQLSASNKNHLLMVIEATSSAITTTLMKAVTGSSLTLNFPIVDNFAGTPAAGTADALGAVVGTTTWGLENNVDIPEIDIKVDSVSVTAVTKKLRARWTPELGQDLNAYHNLDAEVELTSILSEQIALEIDREILEDLVKGSAAGTLYWSRMPGRFVNPETGAPRTVGAAIAGPDFTGTVSEWYETLVETINDVSARIHRKTLRGGANFLVCSPEVANLLEFTAGFRAKVTHDDDRGEVGAVNVGSISKKFDVYVDPYFPRNVILVGRKGNSFLESGYVYAPYVPLQVTPTIFGPEDFVPRKGVMTRYAKKMVRADMYGLVVVRDLVNDRTA